MPERSDNKNKTATFILLSYARPQNIQSIIDSILKAETCGRIVLSNNQPDTDIFEYVDAECDVLDVIQQDRKWGPVKRYYMALESTGDLFVAIDDDIFLSPEQIDRLVCALRNDPSRPHGVWGQNFLQEDGEIKSEVGLHNVSCEVTVLNQVYAFTRQHVDRYFQLLDLLGIVDPDTIGPLDDIILSFCGSAPPLIHDVGELRICPTWDKHGVALWREPNFIESRKRLFLRLQSLTRENT